MNFRRYLTVCLLLAIVSCSGEKQSGEPEEKSEAEGEQENGSMSNAVELTAAQIRNGKVKWALPVVSAIGATVEVPAQLVANEDKTSRVSAPAEARAIAVHVSPGETVARGAPLVTLQSQDANMARADVAKAQAEVASRQAALVYSRTARERAERLLNLKAIPRQEYERAIADDELAKAALSQARSELIRARSSAQQLGVEAGGAMVLRAPISGVVVSREIVPGAVVSPGTPLVTITNPASLWLTIALPQSLAANVRVGATVRFTVPSAPTDTFAARLQSIGAAYDPSTRSLPVRAIVLNAGDRLRPETFATAWISGGTTESFPTVPDAAIQRLEGKPVVFVARPAANGGASFEVRDVEIRSAGNRWAVIRGLNTRELLVTEGSFAVKAQLEKGSMPDMDH